MSAQRCQLCERYSLVAISQDGYECMTHWHPTSWAQAEAALTRGAEMFDYEGDPVVKILSDGQDEEHTIVWQAADGGRLAYREDAPDKMRVFEPSPTAQEVQEVIASILREHA